ncbi:hypothetical protein PHJA_000773700 [Phtheirospermum japonicum]|uniref:Uncharacterized protein n=1 Tax=Phtheirospermum japonicum TaxID=374723 RepID=A0A830BLG9_9LAMI|nr:hypothetical protein PHJA_000773700 [Phtheirospermum japonicum]
MSSGRTAENVGERERRNPTFRTCETHVTNGGRAATSNTLKPLTASLIRSETTSLTLSMFLSFHFSSFENKNFSPPTPRFHLSSSKHLCHQELELVLGIYCNLSNLQ